MLRCPKCNRFGMEYSGDLKLWICLWEDCHHYQKEKPDIKLKKSDLHYQKFTKSLKPKKEILL